MIEIYILKVEKKIGDNQFHQLLQFVDNDKQARIKRFLRWEDAHRALFADILIRNIIIEKTNLKNNEIVFSYNDYGKPFIINPDNFFFNVSHSGIWIVCAIDNMPIGIDVEHIRPIDFAISERFFSDEEHSDLIKKKESEKLSYFYTLWTLKESYIKALGMGLSIPLKSFAVKAYNNYIDLIRSSEPNKGNIFFKQYKIHPNYKLAVCANNNRFPNDVIIKNHPLIKF